MQERVRVHQPSLAKVKSPDELAHDPQVLFWIAMDPGFTVLCHRTQAPLLQQVE
jgi:hypothetical protein